MFRSITAYFAISMSLGAVLACNVLIDASRDQCTTDDDCTSRGSSFSNTECSAGFCRERLNASQTPADEPAAPPAPVMCMENADCDAGMVCVDELCQSAFECSGDSLTASEQDTVSATMTVSSLFGGSVPGATARLCRLVDTECTRPEAELVADEEGVLHLELDTSFSSYLEFTVDTFFPLLQFLPVNPQPGEELGNASLSPIPVIENLGSFVGAELDPERGHILITVENCFETAEGIHVSTPREDDKSIPFYVLDGVPSGDLRATTSVGNGGIINLRPGSVALSMSIDEINEEIGQMTILVRPGFITSVRYQPTRLGEE